MNQEPKGALTRRGGLPRTAPDKGYDVDEVWRLYEAGDVDGLAALWDDAHKGDE